MRDILLHSNFTVKRGPPFLGEPLICYLIACIILCIICIFINKRQWKLIWHWKPFVTNFPFVFKGTLIFLYSCPVLKKIIVFRIFFKITLFFWKKEFFCINELILIKRDNIFFIVDYWRFADTVFFLIKNYNKFFGS